MDNAKLLALHEGYNYLGIIKSKIFKNIDDNDTVEKIVNFIEFSVKALCKTRLNVKISIRAVNEFAISQINYFVGIVKI